MANPLFNNFFGNITDEMITNISNQAKELEKTLTANPQEIVMNMLNTNQLSQSQFNWCKQMADLIYPKMPK